MDPFVLGCLIALAVLSGIPAWVTGSILKKYAQQEGAGGFDWIPFGLLPYGLTRFQHKQKFLILWAYVFSNLVFLGAIAAFFVLRK